MGTRSPQVKRFAADQIYLDYVGGDTRYGGAEPATSVPR